MTQTAQTHRLGGSKTMPQAPPEQPWVSILFFCKQATNLFTGGFTHMFSMYYQYIYIYSYIYIYYQLQIVIQIVMVIVVNITPRYSFDSHLGTWPYFTTFPKPEMRSQVMVLKTRVRPLHVSDGRSMPEHVSSQSNSHNQYFSLRTN